MRVKVLAACVMAFVLCAAVQAAEAGGGGDKKPEPAKEQQTFKGMLGNTTTEGSLATLKYKTEEKGPEKKLELFATGEIADKIKELLKKKAHVEVTGELAKDGISLKVSKITQIEDKRHH